MRGEGTWQNNVDCHPDWVIEVPDEIDNLIAARAYINPLSAKMMIDSQQINNKNIMLTGAGSECSLLLATLAMHNGAKKIVGVYRSEIRKNLLIKLGIKPISIDNKHEIIQESKIADVAFDCLGGDIGNLIMNNLPAGSNFISYGLLSGKSLRFSHQIQTLYKRFHLRDSLKQMSIEDWNLKFIEIWALLKSITYSPGKIYPVTEWKNAIEASTRAGGEKVFFYFN